MDGLSKHFYKINAAIIDMHTKRIADLHNGLSARLHTMIRRSDWDHRGLEYALVPRILQSCTFKLLALEYSFDDGCPKEQKGDLLMLDTLTGDIVVAEVKRVNGSSNRKKKVIQQSRTCCARLQSWFNHIRRFDSNHLPDLICRNLKPGIITEKGLELPGFESGSACVSAMPST